MIKIIATDMDGTLLNNKGLISDVNVRAIQKAKEAGIEVIIATGRSVEFARFPVESSGLNLSLIVMNGALIIDQDGQIESSIALDKSVIRDVVKVLNKFDVYYEFYTNQGHIAVDMKKGEEILQKIFIEKHQFETIAESLKYVQNRFKNGQIKFSNYSEDIFTNDNMQVYKLIVFSFEKDKLVKVQQELDSLPDIVVSSSGYGNLEINHKEAQKGLALERYARKRKIATEEIMAIGDSYNDVSMLKVAGFSVAMDNADDEIKKLADFVTLTNDHHGFAHAVEKVLEMNNK